MHVLQRTHFDLYIICTIFYNKYSIYGTFTCSDVITLQPVPDPIRSKAFLFELEPFYKHGVFPVYHLVKCALWLLLRSWIRGLSDDGRTLFGDDDDDELEFNDASTLLGH